MNAVVLKLGHRGFVTRFELTLLTFPRPAVVYILLQLLLCGGVTTVQASCVNIQHVKRSSH